MVAHSIMGAVEEVELSTGTEEVVKKDRSSSLAKGSLRQCNGS